VRSRSLEEVFCGAFGPRLYVEQKELRSGFPQGSMDSRSVNLKEKMMFKIGGMTCSL
jgi:hypothetical protein